MNIVLVLSQHEVTGARGGLGRWGRAFAERHFDVAALWPRVEQVYRRALAAKAILVASH